MKVSITLMIQKTFDIPNVAGMEDDDYDETKAEEAIGKKVTEVSKELEAESWNVNLEDSGEEVEDEGDEE